MPWIILTIFLLLVFIGAVGYAVYERKTYNAKLADWNERSQTQTLDPADAPSSYHLVGWGLAGAVVVLWLFASGWMMFKNIGEREVAIVYNFSNTITGKRDKGLATIMPWEHIDKENVGIQHEEWAFVRHPDGTDNAAVSKDQQKVFANLAVNYQINAANVVDLYKRVGPNWKSIIIDARVPQVFKEVTATYQTQNITANREQLRSQTRDRLQQELQPYDIDVIDVFVTNLGFSKVYTDSIEAKQKQVQDAQRAQAKVDQIKAEADQKFEAAAGERRANVERARGEAIANRLRRQSLTAALIQWEAIQKLNPNVQIIVCPPQTVCVPNSGITPVPGGGN
jgi:prohibitin 1